MKKIIIMILLFLFTLLGMGFGIYKYQDYVEAKKIEQLSTQTKSFESADFSSALVKKERQVIKILNNFPKDSIEDLTLKFFEKELESKNDKVDIVFVSEKEGFDFKNLEKSLEYNSLQIGLIPMNKLTFKYPTLSLYEMPFLFKNLEHIYSIQDNDIGLDILKQISNDNIFAISYLDNQFNSIISKFKISTYNDLQGINFNTKASEISNKHFMKLKANPFSMETNSMEYKNNELLDAEETTLSEMVINKLYKKYKYISITNHSYQGDILYVSKKFWDKIGISLRKNIEDIVKKTREYNRHLATSQNIDAYNFLLKEKDLEVEQMEVENKGDWLKYIKNIYKDYIDIIGRDTLQEVFEKGKLY